MHICLALLAGRTFEAAHRTRAHQQVSSTSFGDLSFMSPSGPAGPSGKPSVAAMEAAAAADDAANAPPAAGDDDDDMDPRTLEQAVARLAHLTSSERDKAVPLAQWADLYKESGPDGVGAMGGEPVLDLAAWRLGGGAGGSTDKVRRGGRPQRACRGSKCSGMCGFAEQPSGMCRHHPQALVRP